MNKHTPGPWHLYSDKVKDDPFNRIRYTVVATGKTICKIYYSSFEGGPTNAEWDARLIAAAPDLLDALKIAVDALERSDYIQMDGDSVDVIDVSRAAIANATGEQA